MCCVLDAVSAFACPVCDHQQEEETEVYIYKRQNWIDSASSEWHLSSPRVLSLWIQRRVGVRLVSIKRKRWRQSWQVCVLAEMWGRGGGGVGVDAGYRRLKFKWSGGACCSTAGLPALLALVWSGLCWQRERAAMAASAQADRRGPMNPCLQANTIDTIGYTNTTCPDATASTKTPTTEHWTSIIRMKNK